MQNNMLAAQLERNITTKRAAIMQQNNTNATTEKCTSVIKTSTIT